MVWYPSVAIVANLHAIAMEETGYRPQNLDRPELLESALERPRNRAWYEDLDIPAQAVYLGVGISQAHAFRDGNKRTAFTILQFFLIRNGLELTTDGYDIGDWLISVAEANERDGSREDVIERFIVYVRAQCREISEDEEAPQPDDGSSQE